MRMEAEVVPLFMGGVFLVILFEVVFSILVFRKCPEVKRAMIGHVVCILIAFFCLGFMFFGPQTQSDGVSVNHSGQFALFGIFWFIGECCGVTAVMNALVSSRKSGKKDEEGPPARIRK